MLSKASSRLYILRVCKYYGFSLQELTLQLFDSLIMSLFTYAIEVWASAHCSKYLSHIDKFCKRALRYGYTSKYTPITDVIRMKDRLLWEMNFYLLSELGASGKKDITTSCLQSEPNALNVVFLIDVFSN